VLMLCAHHFRSWESQRDIGKIKVHVVTTMGYVKRQGFASLLAMYLHAVGAWCGA
jgi:hypothetical protein